MESIPDQEGAQFTRPNSGTAESYPESIHIGCRPKVSLAGMPDNGPNAGACGGDIMRIRAWCDVWDFLPLYSFSATPYMFASLVTVKGGIELNECKDGGISGKMDK